LDKLLGSHVAIARFLNNQLRNTKFIIATPSVPPIVRDLLMTRNDQVAAGPCRKVAHDGHLDVDSLSHVLNLSQNGKRTRNVVSQLPRLMALIG
jgi:hypothetical protein